MTDTLLVFGPGYSAYPIMEKAKASGWRVIATYRDDINQKMLETAGFETTTFAAGELRNSSIKGPCHIISSIAPTPDGDPVLSIWANWLTQLKDLSSIHYLSSTNVYGNHDGAWVDETTTPTPSLKRGVARLQAENEWAELAATKSSPGFLYRLAGIYGPGRNAFKNLQAGKAHSVVKEGQTFGRIHLDDICATIWAALTGTHTGGIFNLSDDLPTAPHLVIEEAAELMGTKAPARVDFENAEMSEMARSFYLENKKVKNQKLKIELGVTLAYPTYKEGLAALYKTEMNV